MNKIEQTSGPVILCIMDGWGHSTETRNNAVALANTPVFDSLMARYPHSLVSASGADVGLPDGQVGNSEVGHMNIGAGRVVMQDLPRINAAVADNSLANNPVLRDLCNSLAASGGTAHVMGLVSRGGVHSHQDHMLAVIKCLADCDIPVAVHAFTDGRDVLPKIAGKDIPKFAANLPSGADITTITGRYYAMDRDNRWERTSGAYDAIASGSAPSYADCDNAISDAYDNGQTDEFITARKIGDYDGMKDGDALIMVNFRADRARQIMGAFATPDQVGFDAAPPQFSHIVAMTSYSDILDPHMAIMFAGGTIEDGLGEVVAKAGKRQLRLAETEKYPHVTFFFNGGDENSRSGEDRHLVQSPKVATYDLQPEMSADGVLEAALDSITNHKHDLLIINFANPDMVGHTGDLNAAIHAVETVDACVGKLCDAVIAAGGQMLVTADHGNCEVMWDDAANSPHTAHTNNLVPLILVNGGAGTKLNNGRLGDLAPSLLEMMDLEQPAAMTGRSLLIG
ncbi:2,3-bisphosphoglycerate-independent phosphoglycerate mutase [Alphaproteobacteria bacterium]|nr:2,3-bisphosphoglycerate-independent phosphoglycerate mutase [Alphaproteobacteria bacterium]